MYGDGLSARSARYTSTGRARNGTDNRCDGDDLENIAGANILFRLFHKCAIFILRESGFEIRFLQRFRIEHFGIARPRAAQTERQFIEPPLRARVRLRLRGIGVHDQIKPAFEIVEHRDFFAEHQQYIGQAQPIGAIDGEFAFDVRDRFEAEIADESAAEFRQIRYMRHAKSRADRIDFAERIGEFAAFGHRAEFFDGQFASMQFVDAFAGQADDRMASPVFAAFDRFEQVGIWPVGEFQIHRQRRVEIRKHLARDRNAVETLGGERVEFVLRDHAAVTRKAGCAR